MSFNVGDKVQFVECGNTAPGLYYNLPHLKEKINEIFIVTEVDIDGIKVKDNQGKNLYSSKLCSSRFKLVGDLTNPPPQKGQEFVIDVALSRFEDVLHHQERKGIKKYGHTLETFNGRDPFLDAEQELVDAWQYLQQARLENESLKKQIKPAVYAIDMDNTLCNGIAWTPEEALAISPNEKMIKKVNDASQTAFIVIYTARRDPLIPATLEWLRRNNVQYHAISNIKVAASLYVDDLAIKPEEWNEKD